MKVSELHYLYEARVELKFLSYPSALFWPCDLLLFKPCWSDTSVIFFQLKPQVLSLCSRVASLSVKTAKERLCQSEISKKIAYFLRAVLSMEKSDGSSAERLAHYLNQLPMPEDFEIQELRNLNSSYMRETMEIH